MNIISILAQADNAVNPSDGNADPVEATGQETSTTQSGENPPADNGSKESTGPSPIILIIIMMVVMYFMLFRGPQKKQKQHRQMLDNLKKNDRIRTIGGIIGTVVDVRDDEVLVKIDESNNTKMKFVRQAINTVITDEEKGEKK